jgi:hypothetical protein
VALPDGQQRGGDQHDVALAYGFDPAHHRASVAGRGYAGCGSFEPAGS